MVLPMDTPDPAPAVTMTDHARRITEQGLVIAKFYLNAMNGTIVPTQRQMEAAKELASWIGHKPAPPAGPAAGVNFTQMILRVAGSTDDELRDLDGRMRRVPREVMEAQFSGLMVGAPEEEALMTTADDIEDDWDDS